VASAHDDVHEQDGEPPAPHPVPREQILIWGSSGAGDRDRTGMASLEGWEAPTVFPQVSSLITVRRRLGVTST